MTEDQYILSLYRIPGKFSEIGQPVTKPAVLMMHGLDSDMMQWVINDADKANAFILANAGYDVWMGNNRGTIYSKAHMYLDPAERAFWEYYQLDMGEKDVPAFMDFIFEKTGHSSISYVGHSQGTTQLFMAGSTMPEYF